MACPLSNDLRKRIIDAKERGDTEAKIVMEKDVSTSTITNYAHYTEKQEVMNLARILTEENQSCRKNNYSNLLKYILNGILQAS